MKEKQHTPSICMVLKGTLKKPDNVKAEDNSRKETRNSMRGFNLKLHSKII
jgi:hypothetical protein